MEESPRERAISLEPSCSNRRNPFEDVAEQASRKRQRVSRRGSRSKSVDTAIDSDIVPDSMPRREEQHEAEVAEPPSTPTRLPSEPVEPTSRVTINLRTRPLDPIPSSPPSPTTPSRMPSEGVDGGTRISVESESDALSAIPAIETPSTSSSASSPHIELVTVDDDDDLGDRDPAVAIITDDPRYLDPLASFPYFAEGETLCQTVGRLTRFLQYDEIANDDAFCKIRDWIYSVLNTHSHIESFYELFSRNKEFWIMLPDIMWALSWRSRFFGDFLRRSQKSRRAFSDMFCQFARLTGKLVAMDVRTLSIHTPKGNNDELSNLGSQKYIQTFSFLLRKDETSHIGRNLETHYNWEWDDDIVAMIDSFQTEGGDTPNMTRLVEGKLKIMSSDPKVIEELTEPCKLVARFIQEAAASIEGVGAHQRTVDEVRQKVLEGYKFFKAMSTGLEVIIEKHVTFLSADAALVHLANLTEIYRRTLYFDDAVSREVFEKHSGDLSRIQARHWSRVISMEWKFDILKKLITSTQMQLRVVGVTTMCSDLLSVFNSPLKGLDATSSPFLLYFADYLLKNQLVDYLVGIGSHPEIINESNNILGFLIVTKTYKQTQTDKIWQTVMTSQDPRVVEAILKMLYKCLNLYDYRSLTYLCKKTMDVPVESFTVAMRDFCTMMFKELVSKSVNEGAPYLGPAPYDLLVRLIKESSVATNDASARYPDIHTFATSRFKDLLPHGPGPESRNSIYLNCIQEISAKTAAAAGSICVINLVLKSNMPELRMLTMKHGLTQLLVEELESVVATGSQSSNQSMKNSPANQARRELLLGIIVHEPSTISTELGQRLWDALVGSESKSVTERNTSWQILNGAVKKTSSHNVFLATCFKDYLPKLPNHCLTQGALDFAKEAVASWLDEVSLDFVEEDRAFESPALEQIWHMILTAPPNTIDATAISILVEVFVNSALILSIPRTKARTIHLTFVDRCLQQLKGAAAKLKTFSGEVSSGSDEAMVIVASEDQFQEQEKIFARSLAVLREFLRAYQTKPQFAPPKSRTPITGVTSDVEGEPLTVKYQSFDGDKHTEVKSLTLGKLNTAASLFATLQKATGFKNYKVYCSGKEFDPDEVDVCKSLDDLKLNGLVLVQRREEADSQPAHLSSNKPTLEAEITKHFDDLWSYLSMHEKVAQEIYYFLKQFPVYGKLTAQFEADTTHSEIFPAGQPFKCLYAIHALREYIKEQSRKGTTNEAAMTRAISLVVATISDQDVLLDCPTNDLRDYLALQIISCLVDFLREPLLPISVAPHLDETLLQRLLFLLYDAKSIESTQNSAQLTCASFEAILEASTHGPEFWRAFSAHLSSTPLLRELLFEDRRPAVRKSIVKQVMAKCTYSPSLAQVSTTMFVITFWPLVAALIPEATGNAQQCEDTFSLALALFKRLAETSLEFLNLEDLVQQWGVLLLSHTCAESVGHLDSIDMVAHGLTHLLFCAASNAKAKQQRLSCSSIGTQLFRKHMFPELSMDNDDEEVITPTLPLLSASTRHTMADTIYLLVKDDETQYKAILATLLRLVPYDTINDIPYVYELTNQFDRTRAIRSHTGYVGLKNLSNTCYLNSLFTQLFMNIPFREFMLNANVADGGASQKLLAETQNLFSYMQNSLKRFVDPTILASSIRTYEETQIDVTIQMDVDEFYNLLFDRWESQILAEDAKKQFRSFYGGQLVQQVKSKECPHISERLEPFSAIQCDIKGKSCLQESLQAYVDGEIMEGDNKYKCSTCDRHVDAVKRACLKDIPDNLIFHLKRFEFNIQRLQRSKINDHFSFPTKIDMRPYKVEYLMDDPEDIPEDIFELVGILIHSGTAESGHYYSFIRERPSNNENETWVEFNDDCVSPWDPGFMESSCFGGVDYRGPLDNGNLQYDKSWSAYMLFYQRSSLVAAQRETLRKSSMSSPVRLPVPVRLSNHISMENELLMRRYCLYDPSHAPFVTKMLSNVRQINGGSCASSHSLEKLALTASLNHLDQVISRAKDIPDYQPFMVALKQICSSCAECSRDYLEWYCDCPETLRHLLLRNPEALVRNDIGQSIMAALKLVNSEAPYAYGFGDDEDSSDELEGGDPQLIQRLVSSLTRLWDIFHTSTRAWPEFFGLLANIANLGKREATLLLDAGYLRKTLDIVSADTLLPIGPQYQRMLVIISKRLNTRPVSYEAVISLLNILIKTCDASLDPVGDNEERLHFAMGDLPVPLTIMERHLLTQHWTRNTAHILLEKLLGINQNQRASDQILISLINWPEPSLDSCVYNAITSNLRKPVGTVTCGPFLRAAYIYCQYSEAPRGLFSMVSSVSKVAMNSETGEGKDFLRFFRGVHGLRDHHSDMSEEEKYRFMLEQVANWAPYLLTNYESIVRSDTEDFLYELLNKNENDLESEDETFDTGEVIAMAGRKLGITCLDYLSEMYIRQRQTAVRAHFVSIEKVIRACVSFYDSDAKDPLTRRFQEQYEYVLPTLKKYMVDEADEEVSDWEGSDADYDESSEALDGIPDFGGDGVGEDTHI